MDVLCAVAAEAVDHHIRIGMIFHLGCLLQKQIDFILNIAKEKKEDDILEQLSSVPLNQFPEIIQVQFQHAQYLIQALLLIHTDQVDIQKRLREKYRQIYLDSHAHSTAELVQLEADLYSAILTTYQMHLMQKLPADLSVEQINQTFFNVFLRLFGLEDRPDLAEFLKKNVKVIRL